MSFTKSDGKYIGIQFDESIIGDPEGVIGISEIRIKSANAKAYSYNDTPDRLIDGNTGTYWGLYTNAQNSWVILEFKRKHIVSKLQFYWIAGNRPTGMTFYGSNDRGATWIEVGSTGDHNISGWVDIDLEMNEAYEQIKIIFTSIQTSYLIVYEIKAFGDCKNSDAFSVSGQIYDGILVDAAFPVYAMTWHPTATNTLLLEINDYGRFESVVGDLIVTYDSSKGNLRGLGGPVASFTRTFAPADLIWKKHPNQKEHIDISVTANGSLVGVAYITGAQFENIFISDINAVGLLTRIDDI